jgi:cobalt/nickel transport system permease protein
MFPPFILHPSSFILPLWAVHIDDGYLTVPWLAGGFAVAAVLALLGAWRIRDEEIPRVALLTAAFFVASLMHVSLGPTSVHLLFNGLVGVVLGRRAGLAIPVGLFLQAALFHHGGYTTLGVNSCVMALPALLAWLLFRGLQHVRWERHPWLRGGLVAAVVLAWVLSLVFSVVLLVSNRIGSLDHLDAGPALRVAFHPATLAAAGLLAVLAAVLERRLGHAPEFALGLLVGGVAVLATMALNCAVLLWGGQEDWHALALLTFVAHLPVVVVESIVLGFTVGFLVRVKPEMLHWGAAEEPECVVDTVP